MFLNRYRLLRNVLSLSVGLTAYATLLACIKAPVVGVGIAVTVLAVASRKKFVWTAYGTSRWTEWRDVPHLLEGEGVPLGHMEGKVTRWEATKSLFHRWAKDRPAVQAFIESFQRTQRPKMVRLTDAIHTVVFAHSGAGKNVSVVFPFLLTSRQNAFVNDIKGENYRVTAAHRAKAFDHKIVAFAPFGEVDNPATLNVLDILDPNDPEHFDKADALAAAIAPDEAGGRDPHWIIKAREFISTVIIGVIHFMPVGHRSLQEVVGYLADKKELDKLLARMQQSTAYNGLIARRASAMSVPSGDRELPGILSTCSRVLSFLSTPAVMASTKETKGFSPADLNGKVTIYAIIPVKYMTSHAALMRLWYTAITQMIVSRKGGPRITMLIDEAGQLGNVNEIESMLTIGRSYGINLLLIYQSMAQLKECCGEGKEGVLLSNTSQIFFSINDPATATYVSDRLGSFTNIVSSGGTNWGWSSSTSSSSQGGGSSSFSSSGGGSDNWAQAERRMLMPAELMQIDPRVAITFHSGCPPIATRLACYYETNWKGSEMGFLNAAFQTLGFFLCAAFLAVAVTVMVMGLN
jgi:type IV secretion system protein VirD4